MTHPETSGFEPANQEVENKPQLRLETDLIFLRHGKADQLPGADKEDAIDAQRVHTKEGENQVREGGKRVAKELGLGSESVVIIKRSGPRKRAGQTTETGLEGFLEELHSEGMDEKKIIVQESAIPEYKGYSAQSRQARDFLDVKNPTQAYASAKLRKGKGIKEMGAGRSISEEWTRNPAILQQDLADSGFGDLSSHELISGMRESFQNSVNLADRATTMLSAKWQARNQDNPDAKPPRLVILEGSHGFVSEPWLKEVVKDHEQKTGKQLDLEMEYGEFWRVHWPSSPDEQPTLHIGGQVIPIEKEYLKKIYN